ncbi:MAG TPA: helix-turn-helix domain-containing protein [Candidatus Magasanikbacteria bacterium]|nr:helix-turn-helix domain-containing protein [Candidatus Magasanikbacteria bacterium]
MTEIIRLSISEAARIFGINPQTIRRAIKDQEVTYAVVRGRYQLNFESLLKWSQKKATVKNKFEKKGIGQFVDRWKIKNPLYSPNPGTIKKTEVKKTLENTPLNINDMPKQTDK